ncbi:S41 family peptidase [Paenibacillus sp. y28]|uniref:S41 family peptidase n=1 Tax=Paenibacillus sp. y28 TaxID=3129110 RepID=UPI0030195FE4
MQDRGRKIVLWVAVILVSMFASSLLTLTLVGPLSFASKGGGVTAGMANKDLQKLETTYNLIQSKYVQQVDSEKIINGAVNGMLSALEDPFSVYMDQKEAQMFEETLESSFQGIGAEVSLEEGKVTIVSPIKGSPAEKAGIIAGDVILSVNGEKLDGLKLNEAVAKIRGAKGTQAKLEVLRSGSGEPVQIIVVRDDIPIETVSSEMLEGNIGKIDVSQFVQFTAKRFKEELKALEAKGMKGLIIDVRNDPGGLLPAVVEIAEPFVASGKPILQIEDRDGNKKPELSKGTGKTYPIVVLINGGSASASEILAGALKESAGATLVGQTSYGKGTVQVTFEKEMGDGSNIKMTVYKWLTPNGNWIHKKGIAPDVEVEQPSMFKAVPMTKKTTLKLDMTGDDVKNLQVMLDGLGLKPGRTDGYFNDKTELAVKAFQRLNNLPMNGEVDAQTAQKIEEAVYKEIRNPKNDLQLKEALKVVQGLVK